MFSVQKQEGGHYTNKGTTLPVKVSSVPILYTFPPTLTSVYIAAILLVQGLSNMNLNPCFVSFESAYFPVYCCFSCVFPQCCETHSVHRHNNEYN